MSCIKFLNRLNMMSTMLLHCLDIRVSFAIKFKSVC